MIHSQMNRVIRTIKETGEVSRNQFLDIPYDKITRLGAIICLLRKKGWDIETIETDKDTIYRVKPKKVTMWKVPETGELIKDVQWI